MLFFYGFFNFNFESGLKSQKSTSFRVPATPYIWVGIMRMMTEYAEAISEGFAQSEALTSYFQPLTRIPSLAGGTACSDEIGNEGTNRRELNEVKSARSGVNDNT